jgi:glycosyltransferase involved in cell wall biosynthesis
MFFSIVIPLYNKEKFVLATLESVLSQTFSDFEVLVIDDCSTDRSAEIVRNFIDPRIRIIAHETNKGLSAARNTGIRNAASEYIAFIDADDAWKPFFLEKIAALIKKYPRAGIFATAYEELYGGNIGVGVHKNLGFAENEMAAVPDFFLASSYQPIFCYSSVAIRKEVFETAGFFDEQTTLGEDVDFNIRAFMKHELAYYNGICAGYTIFSENQITTAGVGNKTVTDFAKYEQFTSLKPSLKKYLDTNRYALAMNYKLAGETVKFRKLAAEIERANLSKRQSFLLFAPVFVVNLIRTIKALFLKKGVRLTTFPK